MNAESGYLLLVEDDPDILKFLDTTLTFSGYRVITARNGNEGLEAIRKEHPAIVITDIMMPKLDGFGLVHRLRLNPETRDIPVVFITATYVAPEDREFAFDVGATHFIQKPLDLKEFLGTIAELLKQGMPVTIEPLDELEFYDGYRIRLEVKLAQLNKQIARDKLLLGDQTDTGSLALKASYHKALIERDDITLLLNQIHEQLKKYEKPE
jgi:DNA-binding response OmpR family regulator